MRTTTKAAVLATLFALSGLFLASPIQAQGQVAEFGIQTSDQFQQAVLGAPKRFSWEAFLQQSTLEFVPGSESTPPAPKIKTAGSKGQVIAVVFRDGEVVDRVASEAFEVVPGGNLGDIVSEEFVGALKQAVPAREWDPGMVWNPNAEQEFESPTPEWESEQLPQMVPDEAPPGVDGHVHIGVVLYVTFADEGLRERSTTRPVGVFFQRAE